jgi:hypothetical protein
MLSPSALAHTLNLICPTFFAARFAWALDLSPVSLPSVYMYCSASRATEPTRVYCCLQSRFLNRYQAATFRTWQGYMYVRMRMQRLGRRVLATFKHSRISKAWQRWLHQTLRGGNTAGDKKLTAAVTKAVLYRWAHQRVSWCWASWRERHREGMLYKGRLRRLMCHFGHFHLGAAFRGWLSGIAWQRRGRGLLAKAGHRMRGRVVGRAWERWVAHRRTLRRGRRALARMLTVAVSRAFLRWRESAAEQRHVSGEVARLSKARERLERQQEAAAKLAMHNRRRTTLRKAVQTWRVCVLSVETKLGHALEPLQQALEIAQERVASEAAAKSSEADRKLEEVGHGLSSRWPFFARVSNHSTLDLCSCRRRGHCVGV